MKQEEEKTAACFERFEAIEEKEREPIWALTEKKNRKFVDWFLISIYHGFILIQLKKIYQISVTAGLEGICCCTRNFDTD